MAGVNIARMRTPFRTELPELVAPDLARPLCIWPEAHSPALTSGCVGTTWASLQERDDRIPGQARSWQARAQRRQLVGGRKLIDRIHRLNARHDLAQAAHQLLMALLKGWRADDEPQFAY